MKNFHKLSSTEQVNSIHQDITGEMLRSLRLSSDVSDSATGHHENCTNVQEEKVCANNKWYYMALRNRDLKELQQILTGKKSFPTTNSKEEKEYCKFQTFVYTLSNHKNRLCSNSYSKEEYNKRKLQAQAAVEAFDNNNEPIDSDSTIAGGGFLFVNANVKDIKLALSKIASRYHLACDKNNEEITISDQEMREFIILYEVMPWNMEILTRSLEEYKKKKEHIRFTGGILAGKEGYIMRDHRDKKVFFRFRNMTISIFNFHIFPFERIEEDA